jgi:hypothetical protein
MSEDAASSSNGAHPTSALTQQQFTFLSELRSYIREEAGWIRTLTDAIQRGVAGDETATDVGRAVADVGAPYRAEIARVRALDVPEGCESVGAALIAETDAAEAYLAALARWTAAGQVGISLLRENAGEEVHHALEQFLAARDAFEQAYSEAARLLQ